MKITQRNQLSILLIPLFWVRKNTFKSIASILKYHLIIVLTLSFLTINAQQLSTKGKDFWFGFMCNHNSSTSLSVYISSSQSTSGTVSIPGMSWSQSFTVTANSTTQVTIPSTVAVNSTGVVENKGIHITTADSVSVFALNYLQYSADASIIFPTHTLDNDYRILTVLGWPYHEGEEYLIVATANNTSIEITPYGGTAFYVNLNQGQTYQVKSNAEQLTGAEVKDVSCHKLAVFCGSVCDNIGGCAACDHLYEQILPVSRYGKNFITVPLLNKTQDYFRIIASVNNTYVTINGGAPISLSAGQVYQFNTGTASFIQATQPIFIFQYAQGNFCDNVGDPFSLIVPPMEQSINDIIFNAFTSSVITSYAVNIVTRTAYTSSLTLDGAPVTFSTLTSNPLYSYAQVSITSGNHHILSPFGFIASVYGFGQAESYGYSAGFSLNNLHYDFTISSSGLCSSVPFTFSSTLYPEVMYYKWIFGDGAFGTGMSATHTYANGGNYTVGMVLIKNDGCSDTIWKSLLTAQSITLNNNKTVCQGDTVKIGSHNYTTTGVYHDTLTTYLNCDSIINTNLTVNPKYSITINKYLCQGDTDTLPNGNVVSTSGIYPVTFQTINGCDSIIITNLTVSPKYTINKNDSICQFNTYTMPDGNIVNTAGIHTAYLHTIANCDSIINVNLSINPVYTTDITDSVCEGSSFTLPDGTTVNSPGIHTAHLYTTKHCDSLINVKLIYKDCECYFYYPNAFTPTGDGLNENFRPVFQCQFYTYHLYIYNRWGQVVFETTDPYHGWDGKCMNTNADVGVYIWVVNYKALFVYGEQSKHGTVTLIR